MEGAEGMMGRGMRGAPRETASIVRNFCATSALLLALAVAGSRVVGGEGKGHGQRRERAVVVVAVEVDG